MNPKSMMLAIMPLIYLSSLASAAEIKTSERRVRGQYIVVLKSNSSGAGDFRAMAVGSALGLAEKHHAHLSHIYQNSINGFAVEADEATAQKLADEPNVQLVEEDSMVYADATQSGAAWGLDRIDQRELPLNGSFNYANDGAGVSVYVLDTGIRLTHQEFGGRALFGYDAIGDGQNGNDCNGHGTHVAGTVGGRTFGVAKGVRLYAVRVLGCDGSASVSRVIAGIDWVSANKSGPTVANMSLSGVRSTALELAVQNSINRGVTYTVAAGNETKDACSVSPAALPAAITVGASTSSDRLASFSNYGSCVDIVAPGQSIASAWYTGDATTVQSSGTSMASPHVAGAAALYLQNNPTATPVQVAAALTGGATTGRLQSLPSGTANRLLYAVNGQGSTPTPTPTTVPCTTCTAYSSSLYGSGASQVQPNGNYYYANTGIHQGWLSGPSTANFNLYLFKWNGSSWVAVAAGLAGTSMESVSYNGSAGYYFWRITSASGSGNYNFWLQKP